MRVVSCVLAAAALGVAIPAIPGALAQGVTTSYTLLGTGTSVHEPVFVKVSLDNGLAESLVVNLEVNGYGYGGFAANLTRPDGQTEAGPKPRPDQAVSVRNVLVPPSGSYTKVLFVNAWFDFDEPGRYMLEVVPTKPLRNESGIIRVPYLAPGHIVIDVGPRDPLRLRQICEDFERDIMRPPSTLPEAGGLSALTHVKDPVAVPFLARLLHTPGMDMPDVVKALEAIADGPAVNALLSYATDESDPMRMMARSVLIND